MKKLLILTLMTISLNCFANDGTVTVDKQRGTYTVGSKKR